MTVLVIGKECIKVRTAKRRVISNLQMLQGRIQGLYRESTSYNVLVEFYNEKVEQQKGLLEWLEQYDNGPSPI